MEVLRGRFEKQLQTRQEQDQQSSPNELLSLRQSVDSLKGLLASAEQKNLHLTTLNNELQKKVEAAEHLNNPNMCVIEARVRRRSINMRPVTRNRNNEIDSDDSENDDSPLLKKVDVLLDNDM